jgi:soluble lytic murein transglycosylase
MLRNQFKMKITCASIFISQGFSLRGIKYQLKKILSLLFVFSFVGCTTSSNLKNQLTDLITHSKNTNPPDDSFLLKWKGATLSEQEKLSAQNNELNIKWWTIYLSSAANMKSNPQESCLGFKSLAHDPEFPLNELAFLRASQACSSNENLTASKKNPTTHNSDWYGELRADIHMQKSLETLDTKDDINALIEKSLTEPNKKNREDLLLKAQSLAQKISPEEDSMEFLSKIQILLFKNSPRLIPSPSAKELNSVALDFRFHRNFDKALQIYKTIVANPKSSSDEIFQALKNIRMTYKVAQRRNEYINATSDLVNWAKKQYKADKKNRKSLAHFHDTQVLLARTLWTEDQVSKAMQILKETQRLLQGNYPMDEVYFIMGRMEEEKGQFEKAWGYYDAASKQAPSQPSLRAKLIWLKAWTSYKLGNFAEARSSLESLKEPKNDPADKAKAQFWLARSLTHLNQNALAQAELESLIKEDGLGYYGMLAHRELGQAFAEIKINTLEDPPSMANSETKSKIKQLSLSDISQLPKDFSLEIEWLIALDEKSLAEKALGEAVELLKKDITVAESTWLTISSAFARAGLYLPLFATLGSLPPEIKDQLLRSHPDLLFPQPFAGIVNAASVQSEIPQEFIYSIIRQESAFNPEARSAADAFGLMQLLPSVSKNLAEKHNLKYSEATDLYKPEINIPLGSFELKNLMKKYNNQYILAVSGYNANDNAIRGWLNTRFRPDPIEFIEEIPYDETRTYIKLTMRNYVFYRRLLSPGSKIIFPEELLKLLSTK